MNRGAIVRLSFLSVIFFAGGLHAQPVVTVLDVGYGSCIHLEIGFDHYLFDVGPKGNANKLVDYLSKEKATRLKGIFLTHTHPDHAGALLELISQFPTETVYWNEHLPNDEELVLELDQAEMVAPFQMLNPGDEFKLSREVDVAILGSGAETSGLNNNSLVYRLSYRGKSILLTGDVGVPRQNDLADIEKKSLKRPDIFVWPHHGDQLTDSFHSALQKADICVVSVGENEYGLPSEVFEVQSDSLCKTLLRTDRNGMVRFHLGRKIRAALPSSSLREN